MAGIFPSEPSGNSRILKLGTRKCKIYYGLNKWGRTEWVGNLYPAGSKERDFLGEYVKHFNAIELNSTHYKIYPPEIIEKWAAVPGEADFIFCPKFPKNISHQSSLDGPDVEEKTELFLKGIKPFDKHLGPLFLQVSDKYSPPRRQKLFDYLKYLPKDFQYFVEVRNPLWFEGEVYEELLYILGQNNIGLIINDSPIRKLMLDLTVPKCFIRYTPGRDETRVVKWFNKIKEWEEKGLKEAYFFVQQDGNNALLASEELQRFKQLVNQG